MRGSRWRWIAYVVSAVLQLAIAPFLFHNWDGFVWIETARQMLGGVTPYALVEAKPWFIHPPNTGWPGMNTWYAYPPLWALILTPFYAIGTAIVDAPWVARLSIKLPLVIGVLLLAWLTGRLVQEGRTGDGSEEMGEHTARVAERMVLFNPLLVWISAGRGMFDVWILVFLAAMLLFFERGKPELSAGAFAFSMLVKPLTAVFVPALAIYTFRRWPIRRVARATAVGLGVGLVFLVPFLIEAPRGLITQLLIHPGERAVAGFSPLALLSSEASLRTAVGLGADSGLAPAKVAHLSAFLILGLTASVSIGAWQVEETAGLVLVLLGATLAFLLTTKTVFEHYLILPAWLGTVGWALARDRWAGLGALAVSAGGFLAELVNGLHVLNFLRPEAVRWLSGGAFSSGVAWANHMWNIEQHLGGLKSMRVAAICLVPFALYGIVEIARGLDRSRRTVELWLDALPDAYRTQAASLALALLVTVPAASGFVTAGTSETSPEAKPTIDVGDRAVAVVYDPTWRNPANDPARAYGPWDQPLAQTPEAGYYWSNGWKMHNDFGAMAEHGIDAAIVPVDDNAMAPEGTMMRAAHDQEIGFIPSVSLADIRNDPAHRMRLANGSIAPMHEGYALTPETQDAIVDKLVDNLEPVVGHPSVPRVDGRPIVMLPDAYLSTWTAEDPYLDRLANRSGEILEQPWQPGPPENLTSQDIVEGARADPSWHESREPGAAVARAAYLDIHQAFWDEIRERVSDRVGELFIVGGEAFSPGRSVKAGIAKGVADQAVFDATYDHEAFRPWRPGEDSSYAENIERWRMRTRVMAQHQATTGTTVVPLAPGFDARPQRGPQARHVPYEHGGKLTLDRTWETALETSAEIVVAGSWNGFKWGTALEPTVRHGDAFLNATARWATHHEALLEPSTRALVVTANTNSHLHPSVPDPDWTYAFAPALLALAPQVLEEHGIHAAELGTDQLAQVDLTDYDIVVLDLGSGLSRIESTDRFVRRLVDYTHDGGQVAVLGGGVPGRLSALANYEDLGELDGSAVVKHGNASIPVDTNDRTRRVDPPEDATVHAWLWSNGSRYPAAWERPLGEGELVVTALRPQGDDLPPSESDRRALAAVLEPLR